MHKGYLERFANFIADQASRTRFIYFSAAIFAFWLINPNLDNGILDRIINVLQYFLTVFVLIQGRNLRYKQYMQQETNIKERDKQLDQIKSLLLKHIKEMEKNYGKS